jgi:hypothetical protein
MMHPTGPLPRNPYAFCTYRKTRLCGKTVYPGKDFLMQVRD